MSGASVLAVVYGPSSDLSESITAQFDDDEITVIFGGTRPGSRRPPRTVLPEPESGDSAMAVDSILVVIGDSVIGELFGADEFTRNGKSVRSCENRVCEQVTTAALATGGRRLLVVCDVRRASAVHKARAIRWGRSLALRIRYECSINGLDDVSATYAVVADDGQRRRTAASVVQWHRGPVRRYRRTAAGARKCERREDLRWAMPPEVLDSSRRYSASTVVGWIDFADSVRVTSMRRGFARSASGIVTVSTPFS